MRNDSPPEVSLATQTDMENGKSDGVEFLFADAFPFNFNNGPTQLRFARPKALAKLMNDDTEHLVEHFFRHESANLVAVLTRVFGFSRIHLVEDTVQSALVEALQHWKTSGVPSNPSAWVHRVAKNKAIDVIRRERVEQNATEQIASNFARAINQKTSSPTLNPEWEQLFDESQVQDSLLQMIFACCHPSLDRHSQIALSLKILCGFGIREIASALLVGTETAKKRVQRAKKKLRDENVKMEFPGNKQIANRLSAVHEVLYLMFNEGYRSTTGDQSICQELCEDAARLCHMLCQNPSTSNCATRALLALMLFHAARLDSRTREDGSIILLQDQDRSHWDRRLIKQADKWLSRSASDNELSTFHLEAGIAMLHCRAKSYAETDWASIVRLYGRLIQIHPTPVYSLNRAVALAETGDTNTAIAQLKMIEKEKALKGYSLLYCSLAYVYRLQGDSEESNRQLAIALDLATSEHERHFIQRQIEDSN